MKVVDISAWQENVNWQGLIDAGIEGVIVGKSIYMGTLDLAEAIEIAAKED